MSYPTTNPSQSQAPSEKHLEDWIVNNFDYFGEIMESDGYDYGDNCIYPDDEHVIFGFADNVIARQAKLPSGYPDLIIADNMHVSAVELKKGAITYDTLGQCLRYMHDLKEIMWYVWADAAGEDNPDHMSYRYTPIRNFESTEWLDDEIGGIVVGHSIADKNLVLVAATCGIMVVTYKYIDGQYQFTHEMMEKRGSIDDYRYFVNTKIGMAMRRVMQTRSERERARESVE
jgi:hypothetical protein